MIFDLSNKFILLISLREAIYKGKLNGLPPAGKLKKDFSSCAARINKFDKRAEGGHPCAKAQVGQPFYIPCGRHIIRGHPLIFLFNFPAGGNL